MVVLVVVTVNLLARWAYGLAIELLGIVRDVRWQFIIHRRARHTQVLFNPIERVVSSLVGLP